MIRQGPFASMDSGLIVSKCFSLDVFEIGDVGMRFREHASFHASMRFPYHVIVVKANELKIVKRRESKHKSCLGDSRLLAPTSPCSSKPYTIGK